MITLSPADISRNMKCVARKGYNPYNSHPSYDQQARRQLADKARRSRSEHDANVQLYYTYDYQR